MTNLVVWEGMIIGGLNSLNQMRSFLWLPNIPNSMLSTEGLYSDAKPIGLASEIIFTSRSTITLFIGGSGDIENENRMADMGDRFVLI